MSGTEQPGYVVAGRYRLERALARGGMGSVWLARHLQLDVDVAIKFMVPEMATSEGARTRFEREAKAAAKLKSAHIVQVFDYGVEGETLFLVMELLSGEDLASRLNRCGRLPIGEVAKILGQASKGLTLAHEAGIVHRDLKPGNLFLTREGADEVVKILDFGIAKAPPAVGAAPTTRSGALLGTPTYMSPEQILESKSVDARSDIWALGVIAFECLTGRPPFLGEEIGQVLVGICSGPIPTPTRIAPDLGPGVDRFFDMALARPREHRFQRVIDFARALQALGEVGEGARTGGVSTPHPISFHDTLVDGAVAAGTGGNQVTEVVESLSHPPPAISTPRSRKRSNGLAVGIGALVITIGGVLYVRSTHRAKVPPSDDVETAALGVKATDQPISSALEAASAIPPASAPAPLPSAAPPNPTSPTPVGSQAGSKATAPSSPERSRSSTPAKATATGKDVSVSTVKNMTSPTPAPSPSPNCKPNYTLDADGQKHFKPECFLK